MKLLAKISEKDKLKPITPKPRYDCPFYGFYGKWGMLIDSKGNQCALITRSYSPCQMKIANQIPDWSECQFNTEEFREIISEKFDLLRVFPDEFSPEKKSSWKGISFTEWITYVRGPKVPRP